MSILQYTYASDLIFYSNENMWCMYNEYIPIVLAMWTLLLGLYPITQTVNIINMVTEHTVDIHH